MRAFQDLSIRRKLTVIIMATSSLALLLATISMVGYDLYSFRHAEVDDLTTLADIIGSNSAAALAFQDSNAAREVLSALRAKEHVVAACVYTREGRPFATYVRNNPAGTFSPPPAQAEGSRLEAGRLVLFRRIMLGGESMGMVYLQYDLAEVRERLKRYGAALLAVALGSSFVALLLSSKLQRAISEPIQSLAWTTRVVSADKNYSIRVAKQSGDELGLLVEGFNEMLEQIQQRDTDLQHSRDELERRVVERTAALEQEITERRRAEGALRESEEKFRQLAENIREVFWMADGKGGGVLYVSPAYEEIWGRSRADLYAHPTEWLDAVHAEDRARALRLAEKGREGTPWEEEFRIVRPDGSILWIRDRSFPVLNQEGQLYRIVGIAEDITERKQAEESLRERTAYLNALIENNPLAIVVADSQHRLKMCNQAFERLFLQHQSEILGQDVDRIVACGENYTEASEFTRREMSGETVHTITQRCRKDGSLVDVEMYGVPLMMDGELRGVFGLYQDITERKRAEEELHKAKAAAEAASRAKSEFLANMSHEIRTPMNGILGMTDLALDTNLLPEQREYLTMAKMSAEGLLRVIDDILDFSKIEAGRLDLDLVAFPLRSTLGETLKTLAIRAHKKGLELSYRVDPAVPNNLVGDAGRLRQIMVNLVGNAIKFTEYGEVVVRVEIESQTNGAICLHFVVKDTGIGIAPEKQASIFAPFVQADGSMGRRYGGTGLGLTISKRLVELMGGRLWIESELGCGSAFHFTVTLGLGGAPAEEASLLQPEALENLPVLVVDDNATNRQILEEMLVHWRMAPRSAEGGRAALEMMKGARSAGEPFPLVVLDAQMPDMDGFAVAEQIKSDPALAGATVMMLTSDRQRGDAERCRQLGIAVYLTKPVAQSDLLDAILTALGHQPQSVRSAERIAATPPALAERPLRVLLAEDNLVNQGLAVRLLEKRGHTVVVAGNGRDAWEALEKTAFRGFDVVLMDVQMPEMDGFEATAAIRAREKDLGMHIPIIAMTAHALKGDRERCLQAGMDGYVAKPVHSAELLAEIERHFPHAPGCCEKASGDVLDRATLLKRVQGDSGLLVDLVRLFVEESPALLAATREALARGDARALERGAHTLKGTVSNFGASAATVAALRLEQIGREGNLAAAEQAFAALEREIARLKPRLEELCQEVVR